MYRSCICRDRVTKDNIIKYGATPATIFSIECRWKNYKMMKL